MKGRERIWCKGVRGRRVVIEKEDVGGEERGRDERDNKDETKERGGAGRRGMREGTGTIDGRVEDVGYFPVRTNYSMQRKRR